MNDFILKILLSGFYGQSLEFKDQSTSKNPLDKFADPVWFGVQNWFCGSSLL